MDPYWLILAGLVIFAVVMYREMGRREDREREARHHERLATERLMRSNRDSYAKALGIVRDVVTASEAERAKILTQVQDRQESLASSIFEADLKARAEEKPDEAPDLPPTRYDPDLALDDLIR